LADVFVSYSRKDTAFVRELHDYLTRSGKDVWVDWDDIPPGSRWEQDIDDSIDGADSFLFVISQHSLGSEYCIGEFRHAGERGKRIVPVAPVDVDPGLAPEALRQLNWIWSRESDDREDAFAKLLPALDTDLDWARAHTRLVLRAVEWDKRRDGSLLLRGRDLDDAVQQLASAGGKEPTPTKLQKEYVLASRRAGKRRQRIILGSVSLALVVSVALGIVALLQRNTANERARQARSQALAAEAVERLGRDPPTALARAIRAFETKRTPEARTALQRAVLANPVEYVVPASAKPKPGGGAAGRDALAFGEDGTVLVGLTTDRRLHAWRSETGRPRAGVVNRVNAFATRGRFLLVAGDHALRLFDLRSPSNAPLGRSLPPGARVAGVAVTERGPRALITRGGTAWIARPGGGRDIPLQVRRLLVARAFFSADGSRLLTLARRARLWSALDGRLVATLPVAGADALETGALSRDGRFVATLEYGEAYLWTVAGRVERVDLGPASGVLFSPDGRQVLAIRENGEARLWSSKDGRQEAAFPGFGTLAGARGTFGSSFSPGAAFSPDGHLVALAAADRIVRVWEVATRKQVAAVYAGWANALAFAPRAERLAAMTWDGDVVVARAPSSLPLRTRFDPQAACEIEFAPIISPDGKRVMARSGRGASIWTIDGRYQGSLRPPARPEWKRSQVKTATFSGDGTTVAAATSGASCHAVRGETYGAAVWRFGSTRPLRVFESDTPVLLDKDGGLVAVGPRVWRTTTGERVGALDGLLDFSADGRVALVARARRGLEIVDVESGAVTARLRGTGGLAVSALEELVYGNVQTVLSPDGRRVLTASGSVRLWDAEAGGQLALLNPKHESGETFGFGDGGDLALVASAERTAVFKAADGELVASARLASDAISPDGVFAVAGGDDGGLAIIDLLRSTRVTLQTATALPLDSVSYGPRADLLVAEDRHGDVHVVRCDICAAEDVLLQRARTRLARVSRFKAEHPPMSAVF
jgi:WD40 repeat protein